jgi:hypothetical protein
MNEPISFTSQTPRFGLPILFSGQAQKEFYLNEAHALIDSLMHPVVEGESATPPDAPLPGECWIIGEGAEGAWLGHAGEIACHQSGMWLFAKPVHGMRVFSRAAGSLLFYRDGWSVPESIEVPDGGATVDAEARAAIGELILALKTAGVLPAG